MTAAPRERTGLSLLQVLLLLSALGFGASLAIPAWFSRPAVTLDSAARLLARDLRWAQDRAAFEGRPVELRLDQDGAGYRVVDAQGTLLPAPLGPGGFVRAYAVDAVFRGVVLQSERLVVRYDENGRLDAEQRLELCFQGTRCIVTLEAPSGRIAIEGLQQDWVDPAF